MPRMRGALEEASCGETDVESNPDPPKSLKEQAHVASQPCKVCRRQTTRALAKERSGASSQDSGACQQVHGHRLLPRRRRGHSGEQK